VLGLDL
jgi:ribose transport system substrate-binding protein